MIPRLQDNDGPSGANLLFQSNSGLTPRATNDGPSGAKYMGTVCINDSPEPSKTWVENAAQRWVSALAAGDRGVVFPRKPAASARTLKFRPVDALWQAGVGWARVVARFWVPRRLPFLSAGP